MTAALARVSQALDELTRAIRKQDTELKRLREESSGLDEIRVCTHYEIQGKRFDTLPADIGLFERAKPVYKALKGWNETVTELTDRNKLPQTLHDYVSFIEQEMAVKTVLLSVGPDRMQTLEVRNPFV